MNAEMKKIIDEIVRNIHLDKKSSEEIRRELISDIHERITDLQIQKLSEEQIILRIKSDFGEPHHLASLFYDAHRPFFSLHSFITSTCILSILSITTAFLYLLPYTRLENEIRLWSLLMLFGGIGAYGASHLAWRHILLRIAAMVGFFLILLSQFLPLWLWWTEGILRGFACFSDGPSAPCVGYGALRILPHLAIVLLSSINLILLMGLHPRPYLLSSETTVINQTIKKTAWWFSTAAGIYLIGLFSIMFIFEFIDRVIDPMF